MPDKDGAEEKTTKSVVNKRQKQMMGEEGYDIARDMGRVRPSKDKKDATTMPPSKEMEKTRKVNKGPSALDIVKKKYKGQIMGVKKEELDLTKVAEVFGGYIVEAPVDAEGNIKPKIGDAGRERRLINREIRKKTQPKPGEKKKSKQTVQQFIKTTTDKAEKNKAEGDKLLKDINRRKLDQLNKEKRTQQAYDAFDDSDSGRPETGNTLNNTKNTDKNQQTFDKIFKDVRQRKSGEKPVIDDPFGEPKTKTKPLPSPEKIRTKIKSGKVTGDVEPDFVGPKRARSKTATQNRTLQKIKVAARTAKMPVQRIAKPAGSALAKTAKFAGKNPFAALVGASVAKDTFFPVALPKPPTVQGGKVGRRTAG